MDGGWRSGLPSRQVDLKQLRYFVVVGEELHFGRAAERLGISQPPLSQQVARLEAELEVKLLRRTSRSVALTEPGRLFMQAAQRTLAQAEEAVHVARNAARGEVGCVRAGFVAAFLVLPLAIRRYVRRFPGVKLTLRCMGTAEQVVAVEERRLDVGFVHLPLDRDDLAVDELENYGMMVAMPAGHRLSRSPRVPLAALRGEPFIGFPRASAPGVYDVMMAHLRQAGFVPNVAHETDSLLARLRLVGAGFGVSLLPAYAAQFPRPGVVLRPLQTPLTATIGMVYPRTTPATSLARFIAFVRKVCGR